VTRSLAIAHAVDYFDSGGFLADLARRVAFPTESGVPDRRGGLLAYVEREMAPAAARLGATARVADNPGDGGPLLIARRHEDDRLPAVVRGWDIAVATGHDYASEPEPLQAACEFVQSDVTD
jgi:hypothetical protein